MEENKIAFLTRHLWKIGIGLLSLLLLALFFERNHSTKKSDATKDFMFVTELFSKMKEGEPCAKESLEKAEIVVKKHPELHPAYDELLALSFLESANKEKAVHYLSASLKRNEKTLPPYYLSYGTTSLLIAEGRFLEAFKESKKLEDDLKDQTALYPRLRAFNLVRLLFLSKEFCEKAVEEDVWQKLQGLDSYHEIAPLFQEGSYSLKNYIEIS